MIALYRYTIVYSASSCEGPVGCRGGVVLYSGGSAAAVFTSASLPLIPYYILYRVPTTMLVVYLDCVNSLKLGV